MYRRGKMPRWDRQVRWFSPVVAGEDADATFRALPGLTVLLLGLYT
jgi:hypothetical protein